MADKNRSLAAALNLKPEAMQFISGGNDQSKEAKRPRRKRVETKRQQAAVSEIDGEQSRLAKPRREKTASEQSPLPQLSQARVAITIRLTPTTAEALRRASLERKLRSEFPHSQQDIIELAVRMWIASLHSDHQSRRAGNQSIGR